MQKTIQRVYSKCSIFIEPFEHAIYAILRNIAKLVKIDLFPFALSITEIAQKSLKSLYNRVYATFNICTKIRFLLNYIHVSMEYNAIYIGLLLIKKQNFTFSIGADMYAGIAAKHNYVNIGWIRGLVHHINWFRDLDRQISCSEDHAIRSAVQRHRPSDQLLEA